MEMVLNLKCENCTIPVNIEIDDEGNATYKFLRKICKDQCRERFVTLVEAGSIEEH